MMSLVGGLSASDEQVPDLYPTPTPTVSARFSEVWTDFDWSGMEHQTAAQNKIVPQRGDIIAKTLDGYHIVIKPDGQEFRIDEQTFYAFARDAGMAPDKSFRLVVLGRNVLNYDVHNHRAPGSVAHADGGKSFVEQLVAVDSRGLYGAVVQAHREILLFEAVDPHHQGVAYVIPHDFVGIESISFGADARKNDLLLVLRRATGTPAIFWLTPAAVYEDAPYYVHQECHNARWRLHDCLMRYNRKMHKELVLVREDAYNAIVVW
jgi:hypothetical protein